jgi:PQQ-dependent dehydrogenase (methanol/ethanol family)
MRMRRFFFFAVVGCAFFAFTAAAIATPFGTAKQTARPITSAPAWTPAEQAAIAERDWINVGGDIGQKHYSALNQINSGNVAGLKKVWQVKLDSSGTLAKYNNEATPLVYAGIMYITTGNNDIFAFDAATGERLWKHASNIVQNINTICCGWDARGLGLGEGKIFAAQLDGKLVALDQQTGALVWSASNARWQDGYTMTMAPVYYKGRVFVGVSGSEFGARGSMTAYDAKTGDRIWRFYTVPTPGEIGAGTWPANAEWQVGGATIWNAPSIDTATDIMTFTTANADPWAGRGPGDNLFTASMVALDAMTTNPDGEYAWHFQQVHHDIWDYDCPSPTVHVTVNGQPAVVEPCKTGWVYTVNRRDGNPLLQIDEKPVPQNAWQNTSQTQPIPVGDVFVATQCTPPGAFPATAPDNNPYKIGCIWEPFDDKQFVAFAPGAGGGANWHPSSWSPQTGFLYVCSGNSTTALKSIPNPLSTYVGGRGFTGVQFGAGTPGFILGGNLTAMNVNNNKKVWQKTFTGPAVQENVQVISNSACQGGSLATAGNLVFNPMPRSMGPFIVAYNATDGTELWRYQMEAAGNCPPMTYSVDGKQYLAVYACGRQNTTNPNIKGDQLYVFSL